MLKYILWDIFGYNGIYEKDLSYSEQTQSTISLLEDLLVFDVSMHTHIETWKNRQHRLSS